MVKIIRYEKPRIDTNVRGHEVFGEKHDPYTDTYRGKFVVDVKEDTAGLYACLDAPYSHSEIAHFKGLGLILGGGQITVNTSEKEIELECILNFSGSYGNVPLFILKGAFDLDGLQSAVGLTLPDWKIELTAEEHKHKGDNQKFDETWFRVTEWCAEHGIKVW